MNVSRLAACINPSIIKVITKANLNRNAVYIDLSLALSRFILTRILGVLSAVIRNIKTNIFVTKIKVDWMFSSSFRMGKPPVWLSIKSTLKTTGIQASANQ
nr:hypothetical protein DMOBY_01350 [Dehalococcoides mccartyi]